MFKRNLLLLIIALLAMLVIAACGGGEEATPEPTTDPEQTNEGPAELDTTPITFTYFNAAVPGRDMNSNETRIGKILEEKTGVNFKLEHIVGDMNTRIGVMVASGDYPDVLIPDAAIDTILDAGAFIPLNDLLEQYGPDIMEMYGEYITHMTHDDGNIYFIPFGADINEFIPNPEIDQGAFWIQRGILKEAGYPEIKTVDEYFALIEDYAAKNPQVDGMNVIPFTGLTYDWRFFAFSNVPNHLAGFPNDGGVQIDMETFEASVYADSDITKEYFQKLNDLNAKGLLDRELFVANYDEYIAKLSSGRVLGFFDYGWQWGDARNALRDAGNTDREFVALPVTIDGRPDQYLDPPAFVNNRGIGITTSAKNPERIIQFWNELVKEENQKLVFWGFEGEHYDVNEEGRFYRTADQIALVENEEHREEVGMKMFEWNWPRVNGSFSDGNAVEPRRQPEVVQAGLREADLETLEAYGVETYAQMFADPQERPWYPAWSAAMEQGSPQQIFDERSQELTRRHYPRIVLAEPGDFEKEWEDFVTQYRKLDVEAYENFYTEVVQNRINGIW
ncbi:ABC transporter substrate-binding protein [Bacillus alkalicellulosilyticus]|uniref:ABC transporter substrate-binding protein n=1 Tax=Alkalihalobacterium alkalicellulosilyticum TaxID=1912214 RepID=UPI00099748C3|nr:ABC transporter substrate-binding protein [Bacillus alkalicellulosilyticus]